MKPSPVRPILAIDTGTRWCAAGLRLADGRWIADADIIGRGHAERLAPMVEAILREADLPPRDLVRIVAATGPGSFAGARVAVAFARGLALATGAKAVGVSNLAALARRADPKSRETVAVVHDAKRGELVFQVFTNGIALAAPERGPVDSVRAALSAHGEARLTGSGAALVGAEDAFDDAPALMELCDLAEALGDDAPLPAPLYARPPDAKRPASSGAPR